MEKLKEIISTYEDFPKKGILFRDILTISQNPSLFNELVVTMAASQIIKKADAIISIDARGFIFGSAISFQASKPLLFARKSGKLPGELVEKKYSLEYGENSLSIQKSSLKKFTSFAIVDDLLATGGTVNCVTEILRLQKKVIKGLLVVVELSEMNARTKFDFPVESIINY
tara:strand:- start:969 stop:1481 length:513 start_codon:yes stop_codon:yes gene_type:complete